MMSPSSYRVRQAQIARQHRVRLVHAQRGPAIVGGIDLQIGRDGVVLELRVTGYPRGGDKDL